MTAVGDRTRALVAPASDTIAEDALAAVHADLVSRLAPLVAPMPPGSSPVVDLPLLRTARSHPERLVAPEEPFAWRPVFVRRSLGLAVVDACAADAFAVRSRLRPRCCPRRSAAGRRPGGAPSTGSRGWPGWPREPGPWCWPRQLAGPRHCGRRSTGRPSAPGPRSAARRPVDVSRGAPAPLASQAGAPRARVAVGRECWRPGDGGPGVDRRRLSVGSLAGGVGLSGPGVDIVVADPTGAGPGPRLVARRRHRSVRRDRPGLA